MKKLAITALLLTAAACSDGGAGEAAKQKAAAAEKARTAQLSPGQWETSAEVTTVTQQDKAPRPAIDAPVGSKTTASACIMDSKNPPPVLLAGSDAYQCSSSNMYLSGGTLNASLECTRKGLNGAVRMSVDGSYTADSFTANQSLSTFLPGQGDVTIVSNLTARRTGECTAEPVKAG